MVSPPAILASWKEIARYLGKGVRTVQRWEREAGLPVHRPTATATNKAPVLAYPAELDAWVRQHRSTTLAKSKDSDELIARALALATSCSNRRAELQQLRQEFKALKTETLQLSRRITEQRRGLIEQLTASKIPSRSREEVDNLCTETSKVGDGKPLE